MEQDKDVLVMPHFRDYWFIIIKRKKVIIASIVLLTLISLLGMQRQEPVYKTQAKIMIALGEDYTTTQTHVFGRSFVDTRGIDRYENEYEVMRSPAVSKKAAELLNWKDENDAAYIRQSVEVSPVYSAYQVSNVAFIIAQSNDPKKAMDMANYTAKAYIAISEGAVRDRMKKTYDIYLEQLNVLKNKIKDSEMALNEFRKTHGMMGIEDVASDDAMAQSMKQGLEKELLELLGKYTEKHPLVLQKKAQLVELNKYLKKDSENSPGAGFGDIAEPGDSAFPPRHVEVAKVKSEYYALKQELIGNQTLYRNLMSNMKEVNVFEQMSRVGDIKVLEWAKLPQEPEKTRNMMLFFSPLFGLFFGICVTFFLEYMNVSLRTEADIEKYLNLPVIGVIMHMEKED